MSGDLWYRGIVWLCVRVRVCARQQMLEEVCMKNGWGSPTYQLCEALGVDGKLYAYKVNCLNDGLCQRYSSYQLILWTIG